jgi:hypothetical protein
MEKLTELERFRAWTTSQWTMCPSGLGAWPETIERWRTEGPSPGQQPGPLWTGERDRPLFFPDPPFEHTVISEDAQHIVYVNHEGILMKERRISPSARCRSSRVSGGDARGFPTFLAGADAAGSDGAHRAGLA